MSVIFKIMVLSGLSLMLMRDAQAMDLSQIIDQALQNNPSVQSAIKEADAVQARVAQSSAFPDPMVKYVFMGKMLETRLGSQESMIEVAQDIPYPGKLIRRRRAAKSESAAAQGRLESVRRDTIFQVKSALYDLWVVERQLQRLQMKKDLFGVWESSAQAGYASGRSAQRDVLSAQSAQARLAQEQAALQQQQSTLQAALQNLLNTSEMIQPDLPETWDVSGEYPPLNALLSRLQDNPEILQAQAVFQKDVSKRILARQENRPDFKIGFQYYGIGDDPANMDPDAGRDAWMIPVTVTIPFWQNRVRASIHEAEDRQMSSQARVQAVRNQTEFILKQAYFSYQSQKRTVELYRDALIPQAHGAADSDRAGYESGTVALEQWIESRKNVLDLETAMDQAVAGLMKSQAEMQRIIGEDIFQKKDAP